jgi:hypothetical protein
MPHHDHVFDGGGLFGCGDSEGMCMFESQAVHVAVSPLVRDRLAHLEAFDREAIEPYLESYRQARRRLLGLGGILGVLAMAKPVKLLAAGRRFAGGHVVAALPAGGREYVVESLPETVRLGVLDATLPNILEVEPGDVIIYPNTWSHFLNRLQPGVSLQQLAQWRRDNPGRGPHSIIGPVGVKGAQHGDMVSIRLATLTPQNWGANFNNPGDLRTGALWGEFPDGQVRYLAIDAEQRQAKFAPSIELPIGPF